MVQNRSEPWERTVSGYLVVLAALVEGKLSADQAEAELEPLYRGDPWPRDLFEILDRFFGDLEAHRANPQAAGEEELRASARRALEMLEAVLQEEPA